VARNRPPSRTELGFLILFLVFLVLGIALAFAQTAATGAASQAPGGGGNGTGGPSVPQSALAGPSPQPIFVILSAVGLLGILGVGVRYAATRKVGLPPEPRDLSSPPVPSDPSEQREPDPLDHML
jgi:hypothetical protein